MVEKDGEGKVSVFPPSNVKPRSVFVPVDTEIMTTDVMSQAIDGCVSSVRGEISANHDRDKNNEDGDGAVVIQVNFRGEER